MRHRPHAHLEDRRPAVFTVERLRQKLLEFMRLNPQETRPRRRETKESKALLLFELNDPVTVKEIKARYKSLVKAHHPDVNKGSKEAEERFKQVDRGVPDSSWNIMRKEMTDFLDKPDIVIHAKDAFGLEPDSKSRLSPIRAKSRP